MTYQDNRRVTAALIKSTVWGTLVTPNTAGMRIPILSNTVIEQRLKQGDMSLTGKALNMQSFDVGAQYRGTHSCYLDGDNLDRVLALCLGTAGSPAQQGVTNAYTNTYSIKDAGAEGLMATLCIDKLFKVFTFDSIKITAIRFEFAARSAAKFSFDFVARFMGINGGTYQSSTVTTLASATYQRQPHLAEYVWNDATSMIVRLNAQTGGALSSGDAIVPSSVKIEWAFPFAEADVTGSNVPYIDEPLNDGFPTIKGSLTFPKITAPTYLEMVQGPDLKKMDIKCVGKANSADVGYPYFLQQVLPMVKFLDADQPVSGPTKQTQTVNFECTLPDDPTSNPTGMADVMPYILVQNTHTTSPLA